MKITQADYMKRLIIDALRGSGTGSMENSVLLEKTGCAKFTGNQHNPKWEWNEEYLATLSVVELEKLYIIANDFVFVCPPPRRSFTIIKTSDEWEAELDGKMTKQKIDDEINLKKDAE